MTRWISWVMLFDWTRRLWWVSMSDEVGYWQGRATYPWVYVSRSRWRWFGQNCFTMMNTWLNAQTSQQTLRQQEMVTLIRYWALRNWHATSMTVSSDNSSTKGIVNCKSMRLHCNEFPYWNVTTRIGEDVRRPVNEPFRVQLNWVTKVVGKIWSSRTDNKKARKRFILLLLKLLPSSCRLNNSLISAIFSSSE